MSVLDFFALNVRLNSLQYSSQDYDVAQNVRLNSLQYYSQRLRSSCIALRVGDMRHKSSAKNKQATNISMM